MATRTLVPGGDADRGDQAIYDFLAEKERRSGSMRTVRAYSGMLYRFFGILGKPPDQVVATEIFSYAHGTGRRRSEVLNLQSGDLTQEEAAIYYSYRGKGGKHGKRELPQPALQAIQQAFDAFGKNLATTKPDESLWPSITDSGPGITSGTFYGNLRRYFKAAGLRPRGIHIFRHSAAKQRREASESVEQVSRFLEHSSLAVTTVYLRQLEGDRDTTWERVAESIGI